MTIKSFFADSVAAAMREARKELGEDAMLLKSRRASGDCAHLGRYEVVFGIAPAVGGAGDDGSAFNRLTEAGPEAQRRAGPLESEGRPETEDTAGVPQGGFAATRAIDDLQQKLIDSEFDRRVVVELMSAIRARLDQQPGEGAEPSEQVSRVISEELIRILPHEGRSGADNSARAHALIGPPGAGKTSTIIRLAVSQGLARRRKVTVLAAEDFRVGGIEKLRYFCELLAVDLHTLTRVEELSQRIDNRSEDELILIDTPGFAPGDMHRTQDLASLLGQHRGLQRHLVLPASLKQEDLRSTANRFEPFRAGWLLFTKLDETNKLGPIFSEAALSRRPISFVTTGQQVPGDILPAAELSLMTWLEKQHVRLLSAA